MQYVKKEGTEGIEKALASGEADLNGHFAAPLIIRLEAGDPIVILAGLHVECFERFGTAGQRGSAQGQRTSSRGPRHGHHRGSGHRHGR